MATTKNTKKPQTGGETFTSLQISTKNADAAEMEHKLHLLYLLQQTDSKIDSIYLLRGELPLEVRDLEDEVAGLKTKQAAIQKEIKDIEAFIADKKNEMEERRMSIKKYEQQRNNVRNNREFESISKEIEFQQLEVQLAEKRANEGTKKLVEKKEELALVAEETKGREADLEIKCKELENIEKETEKEVQQLQQVSESYQEQLDARMLAAYQKVRSNVRNKMAVVTVVRGACGGCFNKIPPQREIDIDESRKIVVCEYCGRILVSSRFAEDQNQESEEKPAKKAAKKK
jgi:predicted  nucleic acid-binding Zn-ribbon protein